LCNFQYSNSYVLCFNSCYVNSNFYTSITDFSEKQCDFTGEVNKDFFLMPQIFLANPVPVYFAYRLSVKSLDIFDCLQKVIKTSKNKLPFKLCDLKWQFIFQRSKASSIENIVKLPNNSMVVKYLKYLFVGCAIVSNDSTMHSSVCKIRVYFFPYLSWQIRRTQVDRNKSTRTCLYTYCRFGNWKKKRILGV